MTSDTSSIETPRQSEEKYCGSMRMSADLAIATAFGVISLTPVMVFVDGSLESSDTEANQDIQERIDDSGATIHFYERVYEGLYDPSSPYTLDILSPPKEQAMPDSLEVAVEREAFNEEAQKYDKDTTLQAVVSAVREGADDTVVNQLLIDGVEAQEAEIAELEAIHIDENTWVESFAVVGSMTIVAGAIGALLSVKVLRPSWHHFNKRAREKRFAREVIEDMHSQSA